MVRFTPPSKPVTFTLFKSAVSDQIGTTSNGRARITLQALKSVLCMARVPIYALDAEALVKRGRLRLEDEGNRAAIAEAVEALVDDFTEGNLVPAGDV